MCVQNPVKDLRWNVLEKILTAFAKRSILGVWQRSEYAPAIVRTYLKIYQYQPNTNSIWQIVFENLEKPLE